AALPLWRARPPLRGVELAAVENIEQYLAARDAHIADAAFEPDGAGGNFEDFAHRLGAQLHGLGRARETQARVNDIVARRQHEGRRNRPILLDQAVGAGGIALGGKAPPHDPAVDGRSLATVA